MKNSHNSHLLGQTRAALMKDVDSLKKDISNLAFDAHEHATAHVDAVRERVTGRILSAKDSLTDRPLMILGVGFIAGFLLGLRFRR